MIEMHDRYATCMNLAIEIGERRRFRVANLDIAGACALQPLEVSGAHLQPALAVGRRIPLLVSVQPEALHVERLPRRVAAAISATARATPSTGHATASPAPYMASLLATASRSPS